MVQPAVVSRRCPGDIHSALVDIACRQIFRADYLEAEFVAFQQVATTAQSSLAIFQDAHAPNHWSPRCLFRRGRAPTVRHRNLCSDLTRRNLALRADRATGETQRLSNRRDKALANQASRNTASHVCFVLWRRQVCARNLRLRLAAVQHLRCVSVVQYRSAQAVSASRRPSANIAFALRLWRQVSLASARSTGRSRRLREFLVSNA